MGRFNVWDTPWVNPRLLGGLGIIGAILLLGLIGPLFWDTSMATQRDSSARFLPPVGFEHRRGEGTWEHPLGTDNRGRDLLAIVIVGAPNTFLIGFIAATIGIVVGIVLGFTAGFLGGWIDDVIRLMTDITLTIPALMVLIVLNSVLERIDIATMAVIIALFAWPRATRQIRAQVLTMRESGYVRMARLSGASTIDIMFREMLPNLIPYLFASFIAGATGAILAAVGLETLGLGPQTVPTLGGTIYDAYNGSALSTNLWWWWAVPTALLSIMFIGLLLVNLGLDEIANPRLRRASK
ncbi:MAG: ABC transporter permease [Chloroflexi bacterium]|nr:ABC transporter permease [Chloroflexota bacterium]